MKSVQCSNGTTRLARVVVVALIATLTLGCTTRKQYAINEAVLISERRQLEDEIYRVQFELRDALEENARLREQIDGDRGERPVAKKTKKVKKTSERPPFDSSVYDESLFPGGDALKVQPTRPTVDRNRSFDPSSAIPAGRYEDEGFELLPDSIVEPDSARDDANDLNRYGKNTRRSSVESNPNLLSQTVRSVKKAAVQSFADAANVASDSIASAVKTTNAANTEFARTASETARKMTESVANIAAVQYEERPNDRAKIARTLYEEPSANEPEEDFEDEGYYESEEDFEDEDYYESEEYADEGDYGSEEDYEAPEEDFEDELDDWAPVAPAQVL